MKTAIIPGLGIFMTDFIGDKYNTCIVHEIGVGQWTAAVYQGQVVRLGGINTVVPLSDFTQDRLYPDLEGLAPVVSAWQPGDNAIAARVFTRMTGVSVTPQNMSMFIRGKMLTTKRWAPIYLEAFKKAQAARRLGDDAQEQAINRIIPRQSTLAEAENIDAARQRVADMYGEEYHYFTK